MCDPWTATEILVKRTNYINKVKGRKKPEDGI